MCLFYKHSGSKDGYRNYCKECRKIAGRKNQQKNSAAYYETKKKKMSDKTSDKYIKHLEKGRLNYQRDIIKRKAVSRVSYCIKIGILTRSDFCEFCGSSDHICAHHASYSRDMWESVVWLCCKCHQRLHKDFEYKLGPWENLIEREIK